MSSSMKGIDHYLDNVEQMLFSFIEGQKKTAPGGVITKRAQSCDGSCERVNILKSSTTLTTSLATSPASAGPAKRSKMILEKLWQIPPPQVATTRRVPEHHLVLLRRRIQVVFNFTSTLLFVSRHKMHLLNSHLSMHAEESINIKLAPEDFTHNIQRSIFLGRL